MALPNSSAATTGRAVAQAALLTPEQIQSVIAALPLQGRVMLRLLLLQYFDPTQEDIEYMATDRPDPRFHAGGKSLTPYLSREAVEGITNRIAEYRAQVRHRRERAWLQGEVLRKQIARSEALIAICERLLKGPLAVSGEDLQTFKRNARTAVPKPEIRELEARWQNNDIGEDEYRRRRLVIEYQSHIRRLDRERRRLELATREYELSNSVSLQDHEVTQIWGIPISSLAGRKVKYLQMYLEGLQRALRESGADAVGRPPVDLWKETFRTLSGKPVERTPAAYDGMQGTEAALLEKLTTYAQGGIPEEKEGSFWLSITQETNHAAEHGSRIKSLFALQRLSAILSDMDTSEEGLEEDLMTRVSPVAKPAQELPEAWSTTTPELGQMGEHVLKSFMGEDHSDTRARR